MPRPKKSIKKARKMTLAKKEKKMITIAPKKESTVLSHSSDKSLSGNKVHNNHWLGTLKDIHHIPTFAELKSKYTAISCINLIAQAGEMFTPCQHYLIGSSMLEDLCRKAVTFTTVHKKFTNFAVVHSGKHAEKAFLDNFLSTKKGKITEQPIGRSWKIPFLCSTGDFIINEGTEDVYVEIKSTSKQNAEDAHLHTNKRNLMQIWLTMDIFGISKGQLVVYKTTKENIPVVTEVLIMHITKTVPLINKKIASIFISGYVSFLETFFKSINIPFSHDDHLYANKVFLGCLKRIDKVIPLQNKSNLACKYFANRTKEDFSSEIDESDKEEKMYKKRLSEMNRSAKNFKESVYFSAQNIRSKQVHKFKDITTHDDNKLPRYENIKYECGKKEQVVNIYINFDEENRDSLFVKYGQLKYEMNRIE